MKNNLLKKVLSTLIFAFAIFAIAFIYFASLPAFASASTNLTGEGTIESPYLIDAADQLPLIGNDPSAHYMLIHFE